MKIRPTAFSLVELLAVLIVIVMVAALLFPVYSRSKERANRNACQTNIHNMMCGILMYAQDNDGNMPVSWNFAAQVGAMVAAHSHGKLIERGLQVEIRPYLPAGTSLSCPDDKGVERDANYSESTTARVPFLGTDGTTRPDAYAITEPLGSSAFSIFGMSYKLTKEYFTYVSGLGGQHFTCSGMQTACLGPATGSKPADWHKYTTPPPNPMPLSFFALPSQTRVARDFMSLPGNTEKWATPSTVWHPEGESVGFADGHVHFIRSSEAESDLCDGPTSSPSFNGACNVKHLERFQ